MNLNSLLYSLGLSGLFSSRIFLPAFVTALFMKYGHSWPLLNNIEFLSEMAAKTANTSESAANQCLAGHCDGAGPHCRGDLLSIEIGCPFPPISYFWPEFLHEMDASNRALGSCAAAGVVRGDHRSAADGLVEFLVLSIRIHQSIANCRLSCGLSDFASKRKAIHLCGWLA